MKKLIIIVLVIGAAIAGVKVFKMKDKETFTKYSLKRVERMLYGIKEKDTALEQEAIGYWLNGSPKTAMNEQISRGFDDFKKEKGIYRISSYEVLSAELINGDDQVNRYVEVRFKADGKELGVIVRHKRTMEWMD